jgi:hypothetical protein
VTYLKTKGKVVSFNFKICCWKRIEFSFCLTYITNINVFQYIAWNSHLHIIAGIWLLSIGDIYYLIIQYVLCIKRPLILIIFIMHSQKICNKLYLNSLNLLKDITIQIVDRESRIRHQCRKTTHISCHRCLINTGAEKMSNISI